MIKIIIVRVPSQLVWNGSSVAQWYKQILLSHMAVGDYWNAFDIRTVEKVSDKIDEFGCYTYSINVLFEHIDVDPRPQDS